MFKMDNIIFEVITPPVIWNSEKTKEWIKSVCNILNSNEINFLNLPEVVSETRNDNRTVPFIQKIDNLDFIESIKSYSKNLIPIPNKITPRIDKNRFEEWISIAYNKGIRYVVLVGGESSKIDYPGYNVIDAIKFTKEKYPDIKIGVITIFTRKKETEKIIEKIKAGADFFVSQIIFESANMKQILLNLQKLTYERNINFPKVYVSIAPASKIKDIEFMKWLGVEFPSAVLLHLTENESEVENKTFEVLMRIIDEIFEFIHKEKINLGFNVEHVMFNNLNLSEKLLKIVKERF